ncbi:type I toxin-antitoxin system SymE family toxin [Clostridioides difficile]|uniref:type I toxin-antitoxin system SymE family toxin n=1 Tax=Clostridioides difficile TaxID=1496 RepID=UPI0021C806FC|nr:type I toxin-antitoxin system SymE family toxin [Clostridioides difficile]UUV12795.1 type I toxin-antitoxin system SymE family toxin [Clostridioides difficile]
MSRGKWWNSTKYTTVPQIRLQGLWLEQLGFEPGMELKVECEEGVTVHAIA